MLPQRLDNLQTAVNRAVICSDEAWYRHILRYDITGCALSEKESIDIVNGAMAAAAEAAQEMERSHPSLLPAGLASALLLEVVSMPNGIERGPAPVLGLYQPANRRIMVDAPNLAAIESFVTDYGLEAVTPVHNLKACVLYHEIFHALEEMRPRIFTRSAMLKRPLLGFIPWRRGLASASEIGAVHFSRLMTRLSFSPCIFGHYLLLNKGHADLGCFPA